MAKKFKKNYNNIVMAKDKDILELNRLLQECIAEQKAIGLSPKEDVEIYFSVDPKTKEKPLRNTGAMVMIDDDDRSFIVITKKYFNVLPTKHIKRLIHHELIHLNSKDNDLIYHKKDWQKYNELSNKIYQAYNINPLETFSLKCFKEKNDIPKYNYIAKCPRCSLISHYLLDKNIEYNFNIKCHNCGKKLIIKKRLVLD